MNGLIKITVCTTTYNRSHKLKRVFKSLKNQSFTEFEWLIIDDGSTDDTKTQINNFINESSLRIKYFFNENGGKHRAINFAIKQASGELFLILDSDDSLTLSALEEINNAWKLNKPNKKIAGIIALDQDKNGNIIGDTFPSLLKFSNLIQLIFKYNIVGDKLIIVKTKILKKYSFPEFNNEKFLAESIIWFEISKYYKFILLNKPLLIVEYQDDGLSSNTISLRRNNPKGALYNYLKQLELDIPLKFKLKASINAYRFSICNYKTLYLSIININILYSFVSFPIGLLLFLRDFLKIK